MKVLWADGKRKFISTKLKEFCKKQGINIKYIIPYLYKENSLAKCEWKTHITIKDSLLINSGFSTNFWAKAIETSNYLRNRLPTKSKSNGKLISKEAWTNRRQNLSYNSIFGSLVLLDIPHEKRSKFNFWKAWKGILIGYSTDTTKYFCIWAPQIK